MTPSISRHFADVARALNPSTAPRANHSEMAPQGAGSAQNGLGVSGMGAAARPLARRRGLASVLGQAEAAHRRYGERRAGAGTCARGLFNEHAPRAGGSGADRPHARGLCERRRRTRIPREISEVRRLAGRQGRGFRVARPARARSRAGPPFRDAPGRMPRSSACSHFSPAGARRFAWPSAGRSPARRSSGVAPSWRTPRTTARKGTLYRLGRGSARRFNPCRNSQEAFDLTRRI